MNESIVSFPKPSLPLPFYVSLCGISYCDGTYCINRPHSSTYCFEYVIRGEGTVSCKNGSFHPSKNDVYILLGGDNHYYYSDSSNPWVKIWFNFEGTLADSIAASYKLNQYTLIPQLDLYSEFCEIIDSSNCDSMSNEAFFSKCAVIYLQMAQKISNHMKISETSASPDAAAVRDYIDKNSNAVLRVDSLAKHICRSRSQTIRIFKKAYGITPYEYIIRQKIETAKLLLKNSNMSVKAVSYYLTFSDEHYFSKLFKQKTGITPGEWRKLI